ncbi:kinase-like domain-containing protein [Jimgerdemannia flammicorona]|uniref:Kinase-like domain-containing protein n=1 Tax=Jimgerdemannia flammicorona TaxID=994334 RepID=A0A433CWE6_9FUNG|nr:kinase-like domain-containing protein [Jimgerdemannia flammicorona]
MCTTTLSSVFFNETTIEMWGLTKSEHGQYMIIMQYAPKGCADTRSLAFRDWQTALQDAYCIADLLSRLHRQELVHKDLHCGNVVFNRSGKASLVDLGLSQLIQETHNEDGIYGRLEYIPPEVIDGHPYTMESDVYCLGTLIWQLVVGVPPRGNAAQAVRERRDRMREEDIPGAPEGFMEIVRLCWNPNPDRRPPAEYVSGFLLNLFTEQSNRRTLLIWILYHSFRLRLPRKILPVKPSRDTRDFIASRRAAHLLETGSAIFGPEASATSAAQRTPAYTSKFYTTQELYRLSLR